jgi:RNA-splicing ligase RtcB|nr:MAG TPA: tRNA-splicing ligase RtcB [Caudoviricetes sp.]
MFEVKGSVSTAKVFTDYVEPTALSQIIELCNQEFTEGSKIRIMPDVHAGAGCVIGTTMTIENKKIVPNLVGVDIGCGLLSCEFTLEDKLNNSFFEEVDRIIRKHIPAGFNIRNDKHELVSAINLNMLACRNEVNIARAEHSIGTLGGGNHFIEIGESDNFDGTFSYFLTVHSGSRNIGKEVATYYQNVAIKECPGTPKHLAYLSGEMFDEYMYDMEIMKYYASLNREAVINDITLHIGIKKDDVYETVHNYIERIDNDVFMLRKGAVSAKKEQALMIPLNMRDGIIFGFGKGLEDWNYSAPHGAGRRLSRGEAKRSLDMNDFKNEMEGIYSSCVNTSTLDESPMAYKDGSEIRNNLQSVEALFTIKPVYNFKA